MSETPFKLIEEMKAYYDASDLSPDVHLAPKFAERIAASGEEELILYVFRTFADSELGFWLDMLRFVWRQFSFQTWLRLLEKLSADRRHVYQFLWFASSSLAWDLKRLEVPHTNVQAELRSDAFRHGAAKPISRKLRARLEDDFDYESLWRRLEREGAPIQQLPSD